MWHPQDEATAASNLAAFVEWLRATGLRPRAGPDDVRFWRIAEPEAFRAAARRFAGIGEAADVATTLLRWRGQREALVMEHYPPRRWTRDELRIRPPRAIQERMSRIHPDELGTLAADHLIVGDIRPHDRAMWSGDRDDPWPLGVWLAGATLLLRDTDRPARDPATFGRPTIVSRGRSWSRVAP